MRTASDIVVLPITEPLLTHLISALEKEDTPTELRQFFYICIGLIAQRNPKLILQHISILEFLFQAASREPASIKVSITECLSMVFPAVQNPLPEIADHLLLLVQQLVEQIPDVAVKFTFAFPFANVAAREVCLKVLSKFSIAPDLRQSARYGLDPYYFKLTTQISRNTLPPEFYNFPTLQDATMGLSHWQGLNITETLRYLRMVLLHEALGNSIKWDEEGWRDRLDTSVEVDETVRNTIKTTLQKWLGERHPGLETYFRYLKESLKTQNDEILATSTTMLLELVSLGGRQISTALAEDSNLIRELVFSGNELLREKAAHLLGLISIDFPNIEGTIRVLLNLAEGKADKLHGAILAVGSILSRLAIHGRLSTVDSAILDRFATQVSEAIVATNSNTIVLEAGLQALSEMCIFNAGTIFQESQRAQILVRLQALSKTTRHGNIQDRAVLAMGYMSFSLKLPDEINSIREILDALYAVHEQKQVELLFSAGQAISNVAARWNSKAMTPFRDADVEMGQEPIPGVIDQVLSSVLEDVRSPKHSLRKVSLIYFMANID